MLNTHTHTFQMIFFEALSRTIRQKRRRTGLWWRSECGSFQSWKNQDYVPSPGPFHWSATVMAPSIVLWLCLIFLVNVIFPNWVCIAVHFVGSPFRSGFFSRGWWWDLERNPTALSQSSNSIASGLWVAWLKFLDIVWCHSWLVVS